MMRFEAKSTDDCLAGDCIYRESECSFDFQPASQPALQAKAGSLGTTSLLIDTLQIEVSIEHGELLYVWGYFGPGHFRRATLHPPVGTRPGSVVLRATEPLRLGVSQSIPLTANWRALRDPESGWIHIGPEEPVRDGGEWEFARGAIAVIAHGKLCGLWIRPEWIGETDF